MRMRLVTLSLVLAGAGLALAQSGGNSAVVEQKFAAGGSVKLELEAGDYDVRAGANDKIVVRYRARDAEQLSQIRVEITGAPPATKVRVYNTPHSAFHATIELPARSDLRLRLTRF